MVSGDQDLKNPHSESDYPLTLSSDYLKQIRLSYDSWLIRSYVWSRFVIIHIDILDLMDRLLPRQGKILDMGCGFGLFTLYLAMKSPNRQVTGVDVSSRRIKAARLSATRLGLKNVHFERCDLREFTIRGTWDGVFTLDLLHHVRPSHRRQFLSLVYDHLSPEGVLVVKDVTTEPWFKKAFTWTLDQLVSGPCHVWYQHHENQAEEMRELGYDVQFRQIVDRLPYPHVLFLCRRTPRGDS